MNKSNALFILLSGLSLAACGGGSGGSSGSAYEGSWYNANLDNYTEIKSDQSFTLRVCSVNNGYRVYQTGTLNGDSFTIDTETFLLSRTGDILTVTNDNIGFNETYTLVSSIPAACENDAIEITSVTPDTVTEGEPTSFSVGFDYRLASKQNGIIYLGFNTDEPTKYILTDDRQAIDQTETSSGTLSGVATPVIYAAPDSFGVYVNISEADHPKPEWFPLTSDQLNVTVNPASGGGKSFIPSGYSHKTNNNNQCGTVTFGTCQANTLTK